MLIVGSCEGPKPKGTNRILSFFQITPTLFKRLAMAVNKRQVCLPRINN